MLPCAAMLWSRRKHFLWGIVGVVVISGFTAISIESLEKVRFECLTADKKVYFVLNENSRYPGKGEVVVKDYSAKPLSKLEVEVPIPDHYHPFELHQCGIYLFQSKNYDYSSRKPLSGYTFSLWKYDFDGRGKELLTLSRLDSANQPRNLFQSDFRISPDEKYLVLAEGYLGGPHYNLVIKKLGRYFRTNKLPDALVIPFKDIVGTNKNIYGSIGFLEWSSDSRYFWGNVFADAEVTAFFRVDMKSKTFDVYEAPEGTLGGHALTLRPDTGYILYDPNYFWSPVADDTPGIIAEQIQKGIKNELHLHHLPSGRDILVASADEPLWSFRPKWVSNTEISYELPGGIIKTHRLSE